MKRVTGIGGIFFKAKDPKGLQDWYGEHLGIKPLPHSPWGGDDKSPLFEWRNADNPEKKGYSVFATFPADTEYFGSGPATHMFNFRVDDLDAVLDQLRQEGVKVEDKVEDYEFGRFGWIFDPEGNRIELWEPGEGY